MSLWHHAIRWHNPHSQPPNGKPRVVAEIATDSTKTPEELLAVYRQGWSGNGWSLTIAPINKPPRTVSQDTRAKIRRQRMKKRIRKSAPMFADELIVQELKEKPKYYEGINDPITEAQKQEIIDLMRREYEYYSEHINKLLIHEDPEP